MQAIHYRADGNFVLTADLVLSGDFTPIANFSGVLDGQGHTISNLSITATASLPSVAFVVSNGGTIKNLGFIDVTVTGINTSKTNWAAAIATQNTGTIESCYVKGTVSGGYRSAGICAHNFGTIKNCYAIVNLSAKVECGEIASVSEAGSLIDSCYAIPQVHSDVNNTGGISAYAYTGATIRNCAVYAGSISNVDDENIGRITGRLKDAPTFSNNIASDNVLINGSAVSGGELINKNGLSVSDGELLLQSTFEIDLGWDFTSVWVMDSALGRPVLRQARELPSGTTYTISNAADLELLRTYGQTPSNTFVLANDIELTETFTPIGTFKGTLNGNGHSIIGLTLQAGSDLPTVAFILDNYGVIENIGFSEAVAFGIDDSQTNWASIIAATNHGVIRRAYVLGNVSGAHRSSAIVSWNNNVVEDCYCVATIAGKVESGGIAAVADSGFLIKNCYAVPVVNSTFNNTGGISAYAYGGAVIKNCALIGGLIVNGQAQTFSNEIECDTTDISYDQETFYRYVSRHPRTAVGIKDETTVLLVTVDGRGYNGSTGVYIEELGLIMKYIGATEAINMDGGGSTTAAYYNSSTSTVDVLNDPSNSFGEPYQGKTLRSIFSTVLIVAPSEQ